jgi:hypothetical protein
LGTYVDIALWMGASYMGAGGAARVWFDDVVVHKP